MRVAVIQLNTGDEISPNIETVSAYIRSAAKGGATFVSTPETTHLMEMNRERVLAKTFVEAEDPGLAHLRALATEHGIWLHIGSLIIKIAEDRLANRSFLIAPDGSIAARYDKTHLFDVELGGGESYRESALYQHGTEAVVVETDMASFGLSVCYDLRFPYLYRALAHAGANVILVPAAFTQPTGEAHWHTLLRARAIETGSFVIAAAQTGLHDTGRRTYGHSLVIDPWGTVLLDSGTDPGVQVVDLDLKAVDKVRQKIPSLMHDRDVSVLKVNA